MKELVRAYNGDIFEQKVLDDTLVQEYFARNERKKADEKWLKETKAMIERGMDELNKSKADFGDVRVSVAVPDQSYFDMQKVLEYFSYINNDLYDDVTKTVIDEDKLAVAIAQGVVNVDDLKQYAWVEKLGSPRLLVNKVKR